jgi:MYXO-CTERM domain-containing protein
MPAPGPGPRPKQRPLAAGRGSWGRWPIVLIAATGALALVGLAGPPQRRPGPAAIEPAGEPGGESFEALEQWAEQRSYPARELPRAAYFQAFERTRKMARPLDVEDPWRSIGPANRGGRTIALAVDPKNPNVVYAGAASGGLWRMTITGNNYRWEYVDTGFPVLGVNAIAIDPRDSRVMYIGTGEVYGYGRSIGGIHIRNTRGSYGIGILKSSDGGATWKKSLDWSYEQQRGVQAIRLHPGNPDILFAATSEGVFRSRDAGGSWEQVHMTVMAVDLVIHPTNPETVFVSCGNLGSPGAGIYRSTTGGAPGSFQKLAGGLPANWRGKTMLAISQAAPVAVFADVANESGTIGLYRSLDNGDSWTSIAAGTDWAGIQGWFSHFVRVHPRDNNRLLIGGVNFYASNNGGATIQTRGGLHPDHHTFADHPTDPETVYVANDGGVYQSTDGGVTFRAMNNGYTTAQFYNGFASSPRDPNLALGGLQDNRSILYSGTPNWRPILGGDGGFAAVHPQDDNILYGSSFFLRMSRSRDRGASFTALPELAGGSCFISPFFLAPSRPSTIYGGKTFLYRSTDGGDNWQSMNGERALNGNPIIALGVSPTDPDAVYAATVPGSGRRAQVFASSDGGQTVREVTGSLPDRYYIDLVVSHTDPRVVYITLSGYGSPHVFRSGDGGQSWSDVGKGLPDVPTSALVIDPASPNTIYVGNDLGVFVSVDGAATWTPWKDGMPTAALVMDLSLSISNRKIRAVTHGNAVFERGMLPVNATPPPAQPGGNPAGGAPPGPTRPGGPTPPPAPGAPTPPAPTTPGMGTAVDSGCACTAPGAPGRGTPLFLVALVAIALAWFRRR